ncbi:hypothetical protein [Planococcus rifietoensis]|uniref:hypothetical protein n=1 Tax=Planococcus rifietoensis TaxID=200991 RepID=UPI003850FCDC
MIIFRIYGFKKSNTPNPEEKAMISELSRSRTVKKSSMDSNSIKAGIHLRSKQLSDPEFASNILESALSHIKITHKN